MPLPKASSAFIDPAKLQKYLLSLARPVGRFKARFLATGRQAIEIPIAQALVVGQRALTRTRHENRAGM